jgi:hypothetical protein
MRDHVSELREGQNDTSGGWSETDVSEFTISPVSHMRDFASACIRRVRRIG